MTPAEVTTRPGSLRSGCDAGQGESSFHIWITTLRVHIAVGKEQSAQPERSRRTEVRPSGPIAICVSASGRSMMVWSAGKVHPTDDDVRVGIGVTAREVLSRCSIASRRRFVARANGSVA